MREIAGLEVFMVIEIHIAGFWVVTPCNNTVKCHFRGPFHLYLHTAWSSKMVVSYHNTMWCYDPE
jgi:hypothetical protein